MAIMTVSSKLLESWDPEAAPWPPGTYITRIGTNGKSDLDEGDFVEFIVIHPDLKGVSIFSPNFGLEDGHVRFRDWGIL